jgi:hypothetical protein
MARGKKLPFGLQGQLQRASSSRGSQPRARGGAGPLPRTGDGSSRWRWAAQSIVSLEPEVFDARECDALDHLAASVYKLTRNCPGP